MGYGKTTAVEWYLQSRERDAAAICVRANAYSDSVPLFWDGLCRALERAGFAELAGFPARRTRQAGPVLELARPDAGGGAGCVLFLDDFHLLRDRRAAELLCNCALRAAEYPCDRRKPRPVFAREEVFRGSAGGSYSSAGTICG